MSSWWGCQRAGTYFKEPHQTYCCRISLIHPGMQTTTLSSIGALEVGSQNLLLTKRYCWLHRVSGLVSDQSQTAYVDCLYRVSHLGYPSWIIVELYQIGLNCRERQPNEAPECSKLPGNSQQIRVVSQSKSERPILIGYEKQLMWHD